MLAKETIKNLPVNNRFYIMTFSLLLSIFVVCLLRMQVVGEQLYYVQLKQVFGFLSIAFLYVSLIISPVQRIIGTPEWMKNVIFARRAIGVSAVYFALLHSGVSLWGELGGFGGLTLLPSKFILPLLCGATALTILCILALTSFDKMVIRLGYHRWKWIQRLVYLCGLLIIVHIWTIGVHFVPGAIRNTCLVALVIFFSLESWRMVGFLAGRYNWRATIRYILFLILWLTWVLLLGWIMLSRPAEAHVLLKDTVAGKGAILHVTPDDDPVAGEQTSFLFDIQDASPGKERSVAKLTIVDDQHNETSIPARVQGNTVAAAYIFPRQGLYTLNLNMQLGDRKTHRFTESLRVSHGAINDVTVRSTPLWAGVGMLCTVIAVIALAAMAFSRRKTINIYSKL